MKRIYFIILLISLIACNSDKKVDGYKSSEILVVTLDIEDQIDIEKIILNSNYGQQVDSLLRNEIGDKKTVQLKCPQKGEGLIQFVFTWLKTPCAQKTATLKVATDQD